MPGFRHAYNTRAYNTTPYNFDSGFLFKHLVETVTSTDVLLKDSVISLLESITPSDGLTRNLQRTFLELQILFDSVSKTVSEKVLSESIRVRNWVHYDHNKNKSNFTN